MSHDIGRALKPMQRLGVLTILVVLYSAATIGNWQAMLKRLGSLIALIMFVGEL